MTTFQKFFILFMLLVAIGGCGSSYAPVVDKHGYPSTAVPVIYSSYICKNASSYQGKVVGNGECVDLIKRCSGAPNTRHWRPGKPVWGNAIPAGTAIATFKRGKYPNRRGYHAAIYSHQTHEGIYVWDQWRGKAVHLRLIKANQIHKDPGNNANRYRVIQN